MFARKTIWKKTSLHNVRTRRNANKDSVSRINEDGKLHEFLLEYEAREGICEVCNRDVQTSRCVVSSRTSLLGEFCEFSDSRAFCRDSRKFLVVTNAKTWKRESEQHSEKTSGINKWEKLPALTWNFRVDIRAIGKAATPFALFLVVSPVSPAALRVADVLPSETGAIRFFFRRDAAALCRHLAMIIRCVGRAGMEDFFPITLF